MVRPALAILAFVTVVLLFRPAVAAGAGSENAADPQKLKQWLAAEPLIAEIRIEGNQFFSDTKIRSHLFSRKHTFLRWLKGGSQDRVLRYSAMRDTMEVKYLYLREGFLNVRVDEWFDIREKDSMAIVQIAINEGSRFLIDRVVLQADTTLAIYRELQRTAAVFSGGETADPLKLDAVVFNLKTVCANNGYPYATVNQKIDSAGGPAHTTVIFNVAERSRVRFGDLVVDSLQYYSRYVARREVAFKKGEIYTRDKILESQRRLYSTNLFNSVSLDIQRPNTTDTAAAVDTMPNFIFRALERKPHFVSIRTGASQDSLQDLTWDFSAAWGKRNIFVSRRIELSLSSRFIVFTQWRALYHRYQIKYTEPWFFNIRMPLTLTARFEPGVRSQKQPYRIQTWSVALSTRKEWSEWLFAVITGRYEKVNIYGIPIDRQDEFRAEQGISVRRKIDVTLVRDSRRDKFMPQSGSFTTYFAQVVGGFLGGDDSFYKLEYSWARYQPAFARAVYATRLKAGWVKEFGSSHDVPSNDRFYLGGANSIRGFKENSVGPVNDQGAGVGANAYTIFNQELRIPLFWRFWGSVFADIGNGWESLSAINVNDLLFAYGAGLQFVSPAGPIRLDYARHLESGRYKESDRLHLTILYAF